MKLNNRSLTIKFGKLHFNCIGVAAIKSGNKYYTRATKWFDSKISIEDLLKQCRKAMKTNSLLENEITNETDKILGAHIRIMIDIECKHTDNKLVEYLDTYEYGCMIHLPETIHYIGRINDDMKDVLINDFWGKFNGFC